MLTYASSWRESTTSSSRGSSRIAESSICCGDVGVLESDARPAAGGEGIAAFAGRRGEADDTLREGWEG